MRVPGLGGSARGSAGFYRGGKCNGLAYKPLSIFRVWLMRVGMIRDAKRAAVTTGLEFMSLSQN